ncbi:MAG: 30S ribosomal protein S2 [Patescibacteria group bacterium]
MDIQQEQLNKAAVANEVPEETLKEMYKAGVHFGHKKSKGHPKMFPNVFTTKNDIQIINLEKSHKQLGEALEFLKAAASKGIVLFVGTKVSSRKLIREAAEKLGIPYAAERWVPGTLTNYPTISKRVAHMEDLEKKKLSGELKKYTKKEQAGFEAEIIKLEQDLGGLRLLKKLPGVLFLTDIREDELAVREAKKIKIPVVALVDTNNDPTLIDYPISSNDDATSAVKYMLDKVAAAVEEGQKTAQKIHEKKIEAADKETK